MSLVRGNPEVDAPVETLVLLVVRIVSRVADNPVEACVDDLRRLLHDQDPILSRLVISLQSPIDRVALEGRTVHSKNRKLRDLAAIHHLVYLIGDH